MRHLKLLLAGILLICIGVAAAQNATDISPDLLAQLKKSVKDDLQTRMLINAITNNEINSLVLNREVLNGFNEVFNLQTDAKGITNQKSSGRCWLFAGLNIMRPTVMKKFNLSEFEFSQSYLFFCQFKPK